MRRRRRQVRSDTKSESFTATCLVLMVLFCKKARSVPRCYRQGCSEATKLLEPCHPHRQGKDLRTEQLHRTSLGQKEQL